MYRERTLSSFWSGIQSKAIVCKMGKTGNWGFSQARHERGDNPRFPSGGSGNSFRQRTGAGACSDSAFRNFYRDRGAALRYSMSRFEGRGGRQSQRRELRILQRIFSTLPQNTLVLDLPSGAGRFLQITGEGRRVILMDFSLEMLSIAGKRAGELSLDAACAAGDAFSIPLLPERVDIVLSYRILHHIPEPVLRERILSELARTTRMWVVASFFHRFSFAHLRRVLRRLSGRFSARHAISFRTFYREALNAGLEVVRIEPSLKFFSEQWTVLLKKRGRQERGGSLLLEKTEVLGRLSHAVGPARSFEALLKTLNLEGGVKFSGRIAGPEGGSPLFVKVEPSRRLIRRFLRKILDFSRPIHPLWREFQLLKRLRSLGLPVPVPLAGGYSYGGPCGSASLMATEVAEGSSTLADALSEKGSGLRAKRREILSAMAEEVRKLHLASFLHRDLFPRNILVRKETGRRPEILFIDCRKGEFVRSVHLHPFRGVLYDLACLDQGLRPLCTKTERLRILRTYLGEGEKKARKRWVRRISRTSRRLRLP